MPSESDYKEIIGFQIGDYVIDDYIGCGGQAVVYLAHATQFRGRKYALKVFGLMQSPSSSIAVGFNEAKKMSAIQHNSVVRFSMPGVTEIEFQGALREVLYIPMDYADLGSCLENPPFQDRHLSVWDLRSVIGLLDGLQAIHKNHIIHEDIKPANILQFSEQIDGQERNVLRITDFGIAKVLSALGMGSSDPTGMTPQFMFPEQLDHKHTAKGDIYSMGATLFYMITGKFPIEPTNADASDPYAFLLAWQYAHTTQPRPNALNYSVQCPPRLALLIIRMMSVDPSERPELDECKNEIRRIIETSDLKAFQRLNIPEPLKAELDREEFPIRYSPKEFSLIFKAKVHEKCGAQLFVIRIKMGHPIFSQYKSIIDYMVKRLSDCFSLYETWGTYDINILLWGQYDEIKTLKKNLEERSAGCKVQIRGANRIHELHCGDPSIPDNTDPVAALAIQENINLPGLKRSDYLCKDFPDDIPEHSVRAFTKKVLNAPLLAAGMDEPSWRGLDARCQDELS